MSDQTIWVITTDAPETAADAGKGLGDILFGEPGAVSLKRVPVRLDTIEQEMTDVLQVLGQMLGRVQQRLGDVAGMELDEITISVEVNGQGQVCLLGVGGQAGGKGGINLKFKRVLPKNNQPDTLNPKP